MMKTDDLLLVSPAIEHQKMWKIIIAEFENAQETVKPSALNYGCDDYDAYLKMINDSANGVIPSHLVKATTYFLMGHDQDKILGAVNIRHSLNDYLLAVGGHIGYGVAPSERRKGYATRMLALALDKCREIGIEKALITCNKDNIGSAKTILKNGGVLENEITEENNNIVQRYWISLC